MGTNRSDIADTSALSAKVDISSVVIVETSQQDSAPEGRRKLAGGKIRAAERGPRLRCMWPRAPRQGRGKYRPIHL